MSGTGDGVILSACNRMSLMAFAEISTRIGGEVTLIDATLLLGFFHSHARSPHMPTQRLSISS
ncbi:2-hydroxycarboxylate transporter family protein [Pseudomonas sp. MF5691]|nr:2-hydroxycarboxylate transporter family protein [Pseudomonas sp. MF5691]